MHSGGLGKALGTALERHVASLHPRAVDNPGPAAVETAESGLVDRIERLFLARRRCPAAPEQALQQLQSLLGRLPEPLGVAASATLMLTGLNHAYHNRHHVAEAILAMGWLCWIARSTGRLSREQAWLGVLAMVAHDLGHDGSVCRDGRLEREAAGHLVRIGNRAGLSASALHTLEMVILATAPKPPAWLTEEPATTRLLATLAREADVTASLLPQLGWRLSLALQREWQRALGDAAERPASFTGRLALLGRHQQLSEPARCLGVEGMVRRQCQAFGVAGDDLGIGGDPMQVANALDAMAWRQAGRLYRSAYCRLAT